MKLKKSQVTMFIILGLVLFIIISFVLYISKMAGKKTAQQGAKKTQEIEMEARSLKEFVSKCLDKAAKEAVVLVGSQGGYIYKSQGGLVPDFTESDDGTLFIDNNNLKVAYNILPLGRNVGLFSSEVPDYPWTYFPYNGPGSSSGTFSGIFGINTMPQLVSVYGPNSIQAEIESYIEYNTPKCLDFSTYRKQGLEIKSSENPKISATIGSKDISVEMQMQITIENPSTKELQSLDHFSTKLDVRLTDLYFFAQNLINNEVTDMKFSIADPSNNKEFFTVNIQRNVKNFDDFITVSDPKSIINGKPFEYKFARKNRAPALYYIDSHPSFQQGYEMRQDELLQGNQMKAEDTDEDTISFKIKEMIQGEPEAVFPVTIDRPEIKFRIEASDGDLVDYQIITVKRKE